MKKIGIDARLYSQTGVGTYLKNLIFYLQNEDLKNETIYLYLMSDDFDKVSITNNNIIKKRANFRWHTFAEQIGFAVQLYQDNLDLVHFTYFSYPIFYFKKFIATVHDATPLLFKTGKASTKNQLIYQIKHLFFRLILQCQVNRAIKIITPTKTVKKQLEEIYGIQISEKISPIYEGVSYQIKNAKENKSLQTSYEDFFIYVGNFYPHKNVEKLVKAFENVDKKYKLFLLGPDDYFANKILRCIDTSKLRKNIVLLKNPTLSDLIFFYKNALALIHPSQSEGFGLPLIEAAYFNTPIIASNIEVFKELLGNNYLSFNPNSTEDIVKKINYFIKNRPKFDYKNLINKYSFEKMTVETFKTYKSVLNKD